MLATSWQWVHCVVKNKHAFVGMFTAAEGVGGGKKLSVSAILFTLLSYLLNACLFNPPHPPIFLCGFLSLQLLEAQADYHRKSLTVLENVLPTVQAQQGNITCERSRRRCKEKKVAHKKGLCAWHDRRTLCMLFKECECCLYFKRLPLFFVGSCVVRGL